MGNRILCLSSPAIERQLRELIAGCGGSPQSCAGLPPNGPPKPRASSVFASPIALPKAPRANVSRRRARSVTVTNGGLDAKDASALAGGMVSNRCRYKGDDGMKRWVGFGVIADNLINIGGTLAKREAEAKKAAQSQHPA